MSATTIVPSSSLERWYTIATKQQTQAKQSKCRERHSCSDNQFISNNKKVQEGFSTQVFNLAVNINDSAQAMHTSF